MAKNILFIINIIVSLIGLYNTYLQYRKENLSNNPAAKAVVIKNILILGLIVGVLNMIPILINYFNVEKSFENDVSTETMKIAVIIIDIENHSIHDISKKVAARLNKNKINVTTSLFTNQFVIDGIFDKIFDGDAEVIQSLKLSEYCDYLILGKSSASYNEGSEFQGMITATVSIRINIISSKTGNGKGYFDVSEPGAGFSKAEAEKLASERILNILEPQIMATIRK